METSNQKMREALHKARLFAGCCPMPFVEIAMGVVVRDKLCDEIDAALAAPPEPIGNNAKMREALLMVKRLFDNRILFQPAIREAHKAVNAALSAPPRNCDVGTAAEQAERFGEHCQSFLNRDGIKTCTGCPCCGVVKYGKCEFAWAQMRYMEGSAK